MYDSSSILESLSQKPKFRMENRDWLSYVQYLKARDFEISLIGHVELSSLLFSSKIFSEFLLHHIQNRLNRQSRHVTHALIKIRIHLEIIFIIINLLIEKAIYGYT